MRWWKPICLNQAMKLASPAKGVMDLGVVDNLMWPKPESWAKSMSSFCAVGELWVVVTNSHRTVLTAQNDFLQSRRSGLLAGRGCGFGGAGGCWRWRAGCAGAGKESRGGRAGCRGGGKVFGAGSESAPGRAAGFFPVDGARARPANVARDLPGAAGSVKIPP